MKMKRFIELLSLSSLVLLLMMAQKANAAVSFYSNPPGYLIRYEFPHGDALGVRAGKVEKDIFFYGINFHKRIENFSTKNFNSSIGIEGNYISFKGEISEGSGILIFLPVRGIYSIGKMNVLCEIGPGILLLKDKSTGIKTSGFDPALYNIGVGFRF